MKIRTTPYHETRPFFIWTVGCDGSYEIHGTTRVATTLAIAELATTTTTTTTTITTTTLASKFIEALLTGLVISGRETLSLLLVDTCKVLLLLQRDPLVQIFYGVLLLEIFNACDTDSRSDQLSSSECADVLKSDDYRHCPHLEILLPPNLLSSPDWWSVVKGF
ncbi:unnamed protein product [Allacma fusca]|uniref:Uncharacterized protein n=1 Tax=Allacma fusca TaxID=39272 RepID=A0A8J2KSU1_9HEXA|nr:unnamed protein product [Allacma fusca]